MESDGFEEARALGINVPAAPVQLRIGLMSAWNELYQPLANIAAPIMESYCARHGYTFLPGPGWYHDRLDDPTTRGDLCKAAMFQRYYSEFDVLMWMDIDDIIMNHSVRIEDVLGNKPFVWTYDVNGVCSGFWIARTLPIIRNYMQRFAFNVAYENGGGDQDGMFLIAQRPTYRFIMDLCIPGKQAGHCYDFDAMGMPKDLMWINGYEPGDWVVTFPSIELGRRMELMNEYASRITDVV